MCNGRPDSLQYKSDVSSAGQNHGSDKRSLSSARPSSQTREMSPVMQHHKEMSQSVSSAESSSSLTRVGSM